MCRVYKFYLQMKCDIKTTNKRGQNGVDKEEAPWGFWEGEVEEREGWPMEEELVEAEDWVVDEPKMK